MREPSVECSLVGGNSILGCWGWCRGFLTEPGSPILRLTYRKAESGIWKARWRWGYFIFREWWGQLLEHSIIAEPTGGVQSTCGVKAGLWWVLKLVFHTFTDQERGKTEIDQAVWNETLPCQRKDVQNYCDCHKFVFQISRKIHSPDSARQPCSCCPPFWPQSAQTHMWPLRHRLCFHRG